MEVGDLVRWKDHLGVISEKDDCSDRTGWYTITWIVPWIHMSEQGNITQSTMHEEFLEVIARGQ